MLRAQLLDDIHAAFPGLWIETLEPDEAEREFRELAGSQGWNCAAWDISRGLKTAAGTTDATDPLSVLRSLPALADPCPRAIASGVAAAAFPRSAVGG